MVIFLSVWMALSYDGAIGNTIQRTLQFVNRLFATGATGAKKGEKQNK